MIPNFKTPQEAIAFLKLPQKRKCMKCKGKKEQQNGNAFYCNACIETNKAKAVELKKSQAFYAKNPHLIPVDIRAKLGM